jgi:hypothetical protein
MHFTSTRQLSSEELSELAAKLLACPTAGSRDAREILIEKMLPAEIKATISRSPVDRLDAISIVSTCMNYASGIEELIYAVRAIEGDSLAMRDLEHYYEDLFPPPIIVGENRLRAIKMIVADSFWTSETLSLCYRASAPRDWTMPRERDEVRTLIAMLRQLADAPRQSNGTFPMLAFVARLVNYAPQSTIREQLQSWIVDTARALGLTDTEISMLDHHMRNTLAFEQEHNAYLMIKLEPDAFATDRLVVQAWLWLAEDNVERIDAEIESRELARMPEALDDFYGEALDILLEGQTELTVEFFLPYELMECAVDLWGVNVGAFQVPIGVERPVVVRSLDRAYNPRMRLSWRSKWQSLENHPQVVAREAVVWLEQQEVMREQSLYVRLGHSSAICLAIVHAPPIIFNKPVADILKVALSAGIPIALWPRRAAQDHNYIQQIADLFTPGGKMTDLPRLVQHHRREAFALDAQEHIGRYLTLLWDDPGRLPPDALVHARLKGPRKERT